MFSLITIIISLVYFLNVEAQPYGLRNNGNYQYSNSNNQRGYYNYYRNPHQYYGQHHGSSYYQQPYQRQYQGYRSLYQYQGYQQYGNNYQNTQYYQNSYAQPYYSRDKYIGNGIHVDSHGNGYIGPKDTGLYIFCSGRGCPGRG